MAEQDQPVESQGIGARLARLVRGEPSVLTTYGVSTWIFLRLLGLTFLSAFVSMGVQVDGLIGSNGILPLAPWLELVHARLGAHGYHAVPSLAWLHPTDGFLHLLCWGGAALSVLLAIGVAPAPVLLVLWAFYLSIVVAGRDFLTFQWDLLLLETGFAAIFLAPLVLLPGRDLGFEPRTAARWVLWWLVFRLNFMSGVVKLQSGDPTWRDFTALHYHYFTQPLPPWTAWYFEQLPTWFHRASCAGMFAIELGVPFLILAPRRIRHLAALAMISLQAGIAITGNYGFFNFLTIALCLLLIDDGAWPGFLRRRLAARVRTTPPRAWPQWVVIPFAAFAFFMTTMAMVSRFRLGVGWPAPVAKLHEAVAPFGTFNPYGLFAVMTTTRHGIVLEGSRDGQTWLTYELKWKPGNPSRRPAFVAPHMPRLDWRMWFAALASYRASPWFYALAQGLMRGSPEVTGLLATNPFPDEPPLYIRATVYDYRFTTAAERRQDGAWWHRERLGEFCPVIPRRP